MPFRKAVADAPPPPPSDSALLSRLSGQLFAFSTFAPKEMEHFDSVEDLTNTFQTFVSASVPILMLLLLCHLLVHAVRAIIGPPRPLHRIEGEGGKFVFIRHVVWMVANALFPEPPKPHGRRWKSLRKLIALTDGGLKKRLSDVKPKTSKRASSWLLQSQSQSPGAQPVDTSGRILAMVLDLAEGVFTRVTGTISAVVGIIALDIGIAAVLPIAWGIGGPAFLPLKTPAMVVSAALVGARLVAPLSGAVRQLCQETIREWAEQDRALHGESSGSYDHLSSIPSLLNATLWLVWAGFLFSYLGFDVSRLWTSLGASGLLVGLALQHYAADAIAGFTLLADGRFKLGDVLSVGSVGVIVVRRVGVLQTRCTAVLHGQAVSIPNNILAKASITNESRIAKRRVPIVVVVDAATPAAKLLPLPLQLRDAAKAVLASNPQLGAGVTCNDEDKAIPGGAEVTGADKDGVRYELVLQVPVQGHDRTLWKRVHTAALLAMLAELEKRGIKLGRLHHVMHEDK